MTCYCDIQIFTMVTITHHKYLLLTFWPPLFSSFNLMPTLSQVDNFFETELIKPFQLSSSSSFYPPPLALHQNHFLHNIFFAECCLCGRNKNILFVCLSSQFIILRKQTNNWVLIWYPLLYLCTLSIHSSLSTKIQLISKNTWHDIYIVSNLSSSGFLYPFLAKMIFLLWKKNQRIIFKETTDFTHHIMHPKLYIL